MSLGQPYPSVALRRTLLALAAGLLLQGSAMAGTTYMSNYVACDEHQCPPHSLAWSGGDYHQIYLLDTPSATPRLQPLTLAPDELASTLSLLFLDTAHGPRRLFDKDAAKAFAKGLSVALAKAGPGQDALFMITSHIDTGGLIDREFGNSGRAFLDARGLNLLFAETQVDFIGAYLAIRQVRSFDFGGRERPSAVTLAPDALIHVRPDWVIIPLATSLDTSTGEERVVPTVTATPKAASAARAASTQHSPYPPLAPPAGSSAAPTPAAATPAAAGAAPLPTAPARTDAPMPAEVAERRLQTLQRLRDKGLISEQEFLARRQQVLDGI
ncbi:MAG: SHOCT domain-containing protein [Pseudomonadota bacterium]|nr:SHOCT domain-containing protein [Pseudomonadota bacterium]